MRLIAFNDFCPGLQVHCDRTRERSAPMAMFESNMLISRCSARSPRMLLARDHALLLARRPAIVNGCLSYHHSLPHRQPDTYILPDCDLSVRKNCFCNWTNPKKLICGIF